MMNSMTPRVGCWYKELQQGVIFEVVAVDDIEQTIETQLLDGAITEYDFDNWDELPLEEIETPEDWRNGYELSREDSLDQAETIFPENWNDPVSMIESDIVNGIYDDL